MRILVKEYIIKKKKEFLVGKDCQALQNTWKATLKFWGGYQYLLLFSKTFAYYYLLLLSKKHWKSLYILWECQLFPILTSIIHDGFRNTTHNMVIWGILLFIINVFLVYHLFIYNFWVYEVQHVYFVVLSFCLCSFEFLSCLRESPLLPLLFLNEL